jgi:hypothetical protein
MEGESRDIVHVHEIYDEGTAKTPFISMSLLENDHALLCSSMLWSEREKSDSQKLLMKI